MSRPAQARRLQPSLLNLLISQRLLAVLRADSAECAMQAARAAIDGGLGIVEVAFTTPQAARIIDKLRADYPGTVIAAGTVRTREEAEAAHAAGAAFSVSPHCDRELIAWHAQRGMDYIPGALTPTEINQALTAGAQIIKLFPAQSASPAQLKALRAPFPELRAIVTGGITLNNAADYLHAGAIALGAGGEVFDAKAMAADDWTSIRRRAAQWAQCVRKA